MMEFPTRTEGASLVVRCPVCGMSFVAPNKGLGRAQIAAWKTRHQHPGAPAIVEEDT